jgi:hypothetical protein
MSISPLDVKIEKYPAHRQTSIRQSFKERLPVMVYKAMGKEDVPERLALLSFYLNLAINIIVSKVIS